MSGFYNIECISELIEKLDDGVISYSEHDYLQKIISSFMLIQQYNKCRDEKIEHIVVHYYNLLLNHNEEKNIPPKLMVEYFLLKSEIEKYFLFFNIKLPHQMPKQKTQFEKLQTLAQIFGYTLHHRKPEILNFLSFFMKTVYEVPPQFITEIFSLLERPWRPTLAPIAGISQKKFNLNEIEEYFFGGLNKQTFKSHVLPNADRLFAMTSPQFDNHLFLPKQDNFDLFEAALVVHEFQHIQDSPRVLEDSLFISERSALNAERIFLNIVGTGKKGKFCWLESNLFYPILLLKWELDIILSNAYDINNFHQICYNHNMEPISLSPLFDWRAPFQMSAYCAASMDLEQNWPSYLR
ncbi:MAG: hypothetical protein V4591_04245 [Bdellovibrionota bacterium]